MLIDTKHVILGAVLVAALLTGHQGRRSIYSFLPGVEAELPGSQSCPSLSPALEGRCSSRGPPVLTTPGIFQ